MENGRLGLGGLIKGFESIEYVFERQTKKHSRETHELGIENRLANFFDSPQFYRCFTHKLLLLCETYQMSFQFEFINWPPKNNGMNITMSEDPDTLAEPTHSNI